MADQPAPTPAPEPDASKAPAQEPEQKPAVTPAEQTPPASGANTTNAFDSLDDESKAYLKSQGIEDLSDAASITKLINHNTSLRKSSTAQAAELDKLKKIRETITGQPEPEASGSTPAQPGSQSQSSPQELDSVTAFTVSSSLVNQFPKLTEDLQNGKFYEDFKRSGRVLMVDGNLNINGLLDYAKERNHVAELESQLEELKKPNEGVQPDVKDKPAQPADDAPMTRDIALAILLQDTDKSHPRYQEALQFVQGNSKK